MAGFAISPSTNALRAGGGIVTVNTDGSVSVTPASGTGVLLGAAPPATANKGLLSLGNGSFDGLAAGHFAGNANGTGLAMNFASGFAGDPVLVEINGSPLLRLTTTGLVLGGSGHVGTLRLTTGDGGTTNASFDAVPQARLLEFGGAGLILDSTAGTTVGGILAGAATNPLTVKGAASQTADLFLAQNSTPTTLAGIRADGLIYGTTAGLATKIKAGIPADADWAVAPPDGTIVVDSTDSKIYVRVSSTWKAVVVA